MYFIRGYQKPVRYNLDNGGTDPVFAVAFLWHMGKGKNVKIFWYKVHTLRFRIDWKKNNYDKSA